MTRIALDAGAGQVPAELARRGVPAAVRVHVLVEVVGKQLLPMGPIAAEDAAFDWLAEEPAPCTDADVLRAESLRNRRVFSFGSIVLTRFPVPDVSGAKRPPVLAVSRDNGRRHDLVLRFITSVPRTGLDMAPVAPTPGTGLKAPSVALR